LAGLAAEKPDAIGLEANWGGSGCKANPNFGTLKYQALIDIPRLIQRPSLERHRPLL
jgi:hypothetical protein